MNLCTTAINSDRNLPLRIVKLPQGAQNIIGLAALTIIPFQPVLRTWLFKRSFSCDYESGIYTIPSLIDVEMEEVIETRLLRIQTKYVACRPKLSYFSYFNSVEGW